MKTLKEIRKEQGINQNQLGKRLGITGQAISNYESGKRSPNIQTLKKIAEVLDCTIDDLIEEKS